MTNYLEWNVFFSEKKSGVLTYIVDSVSTTNQQNLSTVKNVDLRKSHPHQQNWSIVQIVDSLLDPNQQSVSLKIGETTKCTLGFFLHNNKFVDQQSGSNVQIVVSGPTSTNCVIPNLPRGSRQLYLWKRDAVFFFKAWQKVNLRVRTCQPEMGSPVLIVWWGDCKKDGNFVE